MSDLFFRISPNIVLGSHMITRLGSFLSDLGKRWVIVLDPALRETNVLDTVLYSLNDKKIKYFIFDNIGSRAKGDSEIIADAYALALQAGIDGVVAIGGSRAINLGRFLAAFYQCGKTVYDCLDEGGISGEGSLPVVCVPSTAKNAYMFTTSVPIVDARSRQLKLIKIKKSGNAALVLMDPNFLISLTDNQIVSMIMEILCMAIEAYISERSNFFSDMFVEKCIELLGRYFEKTKTGDCGCEELIMEAGCLASLASSVSSIGVASLLALTASARFNLQKAHTSAILLPYLIEEAAGYKAALLNKIAQLLSVAKDTSSQEENIALLTDFIRHRMATVNLPSRLKDMAVNMEQLAVIVEDASKLEVMNNLQRSLTADDLFEFIKRAY